MPLQPTTFLLAAAALAAVLALILLAARVARRSGLILPGLPAPGARTRRMVVEDTLALDTRRRLLLIRCDDRHLLLLTGATTDLVVGWLGEAAGGGS